ncbi:MAG: ATP cone domain-containing protein, partial [bacterium]
MSTTILSSNWSELVRGDARGRDGNPPGDAPRPIVRRVVKRDGSTEGYDRGKIRAAMGAAFEAVGATAEANRLEELLVAVEEKLAGFMSTRHPNSAPAIEEIQDIVETVLVESRETAAAKAYILYRARHEAMRDTQ